jgi:hypothetical protein
MKYDNLRAEYDQKVKDLLNTIDQKEVGKPWFYMLIRLEHMLSRKHLHANLFICDTL